MSKNVLITGGCGFIGSNLSRYLLNNTDYNIIIVDKLSYATKGFERVKDLPKDRVQIYTWDLVVPITPGLSRLFGDVNIILHLAAESHVDNSISNPVPFIQNNINSTCQILEYAKTLKNLEYFFLFSTDEVFGNLELDSVLCDESSRHNPRNPYSASKSACEMICLSYANTYKIPVMSVNCMNVYGKMQHVEKFIPKVIDMMLKDETISIHSYPDCITAGSRFYIHVDDVARAVLFIMKNGNLGECYNIAGQIELDNLSLAKMIARCMKKELKYQMVAHDASRSGHDLRYGLDGTKLANMGFNIEANFQENLQEIVDWTLENLEWLEE